MWFKGRYVNIFAAIVLGLCFSVFSVVKLYGTDNVHQGASLRHGTKNGISKNTVPIDKKRTFSLDQREAEMGVFSCCFEKHSEMDLQFIRLSCAGDDKSVEHAVARIAPAAGSNLFSFEVDGTEYLYGIQNNDGEKAVLGTPILYPTPNRVKNAQFTFGGRTFTFMPNNGTNFIHGLVREAGWTYDDPVITEEHVSITTRISMKPGSELNRLFPVNNTLEMTGTLTRDSFRFDFTIRNEDDTCLLPFGLAIHPYFNIIGPRESVRLQVPAKKWMEAEELLPTGRLIDLKDGPADLSNPVHLSQLDLDDVCWGMEPGKPAVIYYDHIGKKVTLTTSDIFTHIVIYTPPKAPFFCVENQSCSTDVHNLYARGLENEARLLILKPGESLTAWIEITVTDQ